MEALGPGRLGSRCRVEVETIPVLGADPRGLEIVTTARGPVFSGSVDEGSGLSLRAASSVLGDLGFDAILPLLRARTVDDVDARLRRLGRAGQQRRRSPTGTAPCATASPAGSRSATTRNRRGIVDAADPAHRLDRLARPAAARPTYPPDGQVVTANERRGPESDRDRHHVRAAAPRPPPPRPDGRSRRPDRRGLRRLPRRHPAARPRPGASHCSTGPSPAWRAARCARRSARWDGRMDADSPGAAAFAAWRSAFVSRLARGAGVRAARRTGHRRPGAGAVAGPDRPDRCGGRGPGRRRRAVRDRPDQAGRDAPSTTPPATPRPGARPTC